VDIEQSERRMSCASKISMAQVTHGLFIRHHKNRVAIPSEHLLSMGLNVYADIYAGGAFALPWAKSLLQGDEELTGESVKRLSGNGMHMSCLVAFLLVV
jgi:hypothetical protein